MGQFVFERQARIVGRRLMTGFLVVFVLVAVLSLIVAFVGAQFVRGWATQQIEEHLNRPVEIGAARLTLLPRPRIALEQLVIHEHDSEDVFLRANRLTVVLQLLPLVHLALVPSLVNIEQPQLALRRAPDGRWNILAPPSASGASSPSEPWGALWGAGAIQVRDGRVTVEDRARRDGIRRVSLAAVDLRITPARPGLGAALHLEAEMPSDHASAHLVLDGHLNQTDRAVAMPAFDGSVAAERINLRQLLVFFGPRPVPPQIRGTASLHAQVRLVPGRRGTDLTLVNLVADVGRLHLEGRASLTALLNERTRLVLTVSTNQINLRDLPAIYPLQWLPPTLRGLVTQLDLGGEVAATAVTVTAVAAPNLQVGLSGEFRVRAGYMRLGRDGTEGRGLAETVVVESDRVDATGPLSVSVHGAVSVQITLSGSLDKPRLDGEFDLQEAAINLPGVLEKPDGTPSTLRFTVTRSAAASRWLIRQFDVHVASLVVSGSGHFRLGTPWQFSVMVRSQPVELATLPQAVSVAGLQAGTLAFTLHISGVGADWTAWETTGVLTLRHGTLKPRGWSAPLTHVDVDLRLTPTGTALERAQMRIKDNDLVASGWIARWTPAPHATLQIASNHFDLALLRSGAVSGGAWPDTLVGRGRMDAGVHIGEARYEGQRVTNLSGQVHVVDDTVTVDDLQGRMGDGQLGAHLHLRLPPGQRVQTELELNLARVPTEEVLHGLHVKDSPIVGPLDLTGTLTAHGSLTTLAGHLRLHIERGLIHRLSVLSKLLGILNAPALLAGKVDLIHQGMSFDRITATMSLKGGRITSQDLLVDSPVMKISAAGSYDLPSDRLDVISAVSPLGSYSDLLQRIPLFGKVLADDRNSIVSAVFKVKGPLKDPDVRYLPLRSLTTDLGGLVQRALDVLKRTVLFPIARQGSGPGDPDH